MGWWIASLDILRKGTTIFWPAKQFVKMAFYALESRKIGKIYTLESRKFSDFMLWKADSHVDVWVAVLIFGTWFSKFIDSIPRFWQNLWIICHLWCNCCFWRTHEQKEIDYVEDRDGQLSAFEFKYSPMKKVVVPKHFVEAYPTATFKVITPDNFEEFMLEG